MFYWLGDRPEKELVNMMKPYPAENMKTYMVDKAVNSPFNDVPECIEEKKDSGHLFD
jgi:putative SOS response-associated peptidase YedK